MLKLQNISQTNNNKVCCIDVLGSPGAHSGGVLADDLGTRDEGYRHAQQGHRERNRTLVTCYCIVGIWVGRSTTTP